MKEKKENNKFLQIIKKKWLVNGTKTLILVAIIILLFIAINIGMQKLELTPIDLSQEKLYTLTDSSKEKVKDIDKNVNIYFVGYSNDESTVDLAKQYRKVNQKIVTEVVDATSRPDLVQKYGIESGTQGIIIECEEKSKVLTSNDLVTYDTETYETISIAEEKLTSAIMSVVANKIPKVYFLEGYTEYTLTQTMNYLSLYLANEVNEISTLDILTKGKVPDDCDTLIICTPSKDFDDIATNAILEYINSGKNILWLNAAFNVDQSFTNVNKVLAVYGINPFEKGRIVETDSEKMLSNSPYIIKPDVSSAKVTKNIVNGTGVFLLNATKINLVNDEEIQNLNVTKTELLKSSEKSYFDKNVSEQADTTEFGEYLVGAELEKTITPAEEETGKSAVKSKMIIYGENQFITDMQITSNSSMVLLQLGGNKDLMLNSIAYLVDREEDITARKNTGAVNYALTEQEEIIIKCVIFTVPSLIIISGIIVWLVRRRKK